ncbi:DUF2505 domain-containing protein [Nocardioides antri]|uniref:DUF2505 domain-containing protein n=1 Tax=Nocardioides antri TaxID=2607659 RepID=UPI00165F1025|nr:DUF2505 domain-containing protein [Nocardioides antri]
MRFQHTSSYDAPVDAVFAMLTDARWREKVAEARGVVSSDVTVTPEGPESSGYRIVIDQVQDTAGLPAIAKKITGDTTRAVVTEVWTSPTAGTIEILVPGKPTKATGTVSLVSDGASTRHVTDLELTVKVPLIGGRLEQLMADDIGKGLEVEQAVGVAWLEGNH